MLPVRIPGHVGGLAEQSVDRRQRRIDVFPGLGFGVGRFLPAAEDPDDLAGRIELDDHVGALVDGPDVVVLVDAHAVRERPGVEALADFPQELALGTELEQLRRGGRIGRTAGAVRSREHEDVALGIHGHARDLAEIHPGRKLEEVRNRIEGNFRNALLSERWSGQQHRQCAQRQVFITASGDHGVHRSTGAREERRRVKTSYSLMAVSETLEAHDEQTMACF